MSNPMTDRIYKLRQMPISICPKGAPVLVAGGIAMLKTGGVWVSGVSDPPFTRELNWAPEWWSCIPQQNKPLETHKETQDHVVFVAKIGSHAPIVADGQDGNPDFTKGTATTTTTDGKPTRIVWEADQ